MIEAVRNEGSKRVCSLAVLAAPAQRHRGGVRDGQEPVARDGAAAAQHHLPAKR